MRSMERRSKEKERKKKKIKSGYYERLKSLRRVFLPLSFRVVRWREKGTGSRRWW